MTIGRLAAQTGTTPRVLRYYEEQGLLQPERTAGGQRRYATDAVERIRLFRALIDAGLGTRTIKELLPCMETKTVSAETVAILRRELERIRGHALGLQRTGDRLEEILESVT
ncbi:MerR family transcriptional regulator (plasmid) [Rhodococcus sp. USK10]|nr:MerR family transcriptional regulator [Rhodococcus sp. USK10]